MKKYRLQIPIIAFFILFGCFGLARVSLAATTSINCSSASSFQTAVAGAVNGDILTCTSGGPYTWTSYVTISKPLTIDGNGVSITGTGAGTYGSPPGGFLINASAIGNTRLTNFSLSGPWMVETQENGGTTCNSGTMTTWTRIDHITFHVLASNPGTIVQTSSNCRVLIDNNIFNSDTGEEIIHNTAMWGGGSNWQNSAPGWTVDVVPGSDNAVYVEGNTFQPTFTAQYAGAAAAMQNYYGARTVFRHNHVYYMDYDNHGTVGYVGGRWWEIYDNDWHGQAGGNLASMINLRAGSGVVFGNTWDNVGNLSGGIHIYEEDTCNSGTGSNQPFFCLPLAYQVGTGKETSTGSNTSFALGPAYIWNNTIIGGRALSIGNDNPDIIVPDTYYYTSAKPDYTPYIYPHPLRNESGSDPTPPAAPTGLSVN